MAQLKTTGGDKVEIIKTIAPDWKEVGILMDLDPNAQKSNALKQTMHAHKIYMEWFSHLLLTLYQPMTAKAVMSSHKP